MTIPVSVALLNGSAAPTHERVLTLTDALQTFVFEDVAVEPTPSLLRGFSAPVRVLFDYRVDQLVALACHDNDGVVRWQAMRDLFFHAYHETSAAEASAALSEAVATLLADSDSDPALIAQLLTFASEDEIAERAETIDAQAIANRRDVLLKSVIARNHAALLARFDNERAKLDQRPYTMAARDAAHRALSAATLALANTIPSAPSIERAKLLFDRADNLTDVEAAMRALRDVSCPERESMYRAFHDRWIDEATMLNRWFTLQVTTRIGRASDALSCASRLLEHPRFDSKNPNRVRAVVQQFATNHWPGFHAESGAGYEFVADQIIAFDAGNPSLAARFCSAFSRWNRFEPRARSQQQSALKRIQAVKSLSPNVGEWVEKTLAAGVGN
jgi:aminopeptidase N